MKARMLSGIKPTGNIHIGNYFGAMRQFIKLQESHDVFVFIADLHAINQVSDPIALRDQIIDVATAYLAVGLDPSKVNLFRQSDIAEHSELSVIFNAITSMGLLERAHAYKDALAKGKSVNMGLFTYPVLMASDILIYKPELVPVGSDQQQHIEMANDIAGRFNHMYGQTFPEAKPYIMSESAIVPGIDGRKMSKSYNNVIGLFDEYEVLKKKVMSIKTDSKRPEEPKEADDLLIIYKYIATSGEIQEMEEAYAKGGMGYKEVKDRLLEALERFVAPIRQKKLELITRKDYITDVLAKGQSTAQPIARATLDEVKQKVGLKI